jgi:hypothetical protein
MDLGRKVFVIHGRDGHARRELFTFLRALGLEPIEWAEALAESGGGAPVIGDVLDTVITAKRAFIVLLTPDDIAQLRPELAHDDDELEVRPTGQPRPNVFFEAGMAFGRHPEHTILVEFGKVRRFTDIGGRYIVKLDGSDTSRTKLRNRLEAIGCDVKQHGTDWLKAGNLTPPETASLTPAAATATRPRPNQPEFSSNAGKWNVELENFTASRSGLGVVMYGEATNNEPTALTFVLKATFFDADGMILGSADGFVNEIDSGERRTFELRASERIENYTRVHIHIDNCIAV